MADEIRTFKNIQDEIIDLSKAEDTASLRTSLKRWINQIQSRIVSQKSYKWASITRPLLMPPRYTTGTIAVTQNGYTITGTNTVWTSFAHRFNKIKIGSYRTPFVVNRVASATSITLNAPYPDATASGVTYSIYRDEFPLYPDYQDIVRVEVPGSIYDTTLIGPREFGKIRYRSPFTTGTPRTFTIDGFGYYKAKTWADWLPNQDFFEPDPDTTVPINPVLHSWPGVRTDEVSAQITYTRVPPVLVSDNDEPMMPLQYREVLVYGVLIIRFLRGRDKDTTEEWKKQYKTIIRQMETDVEQTDDYMEFISDRRDNRPVSTSGWNYSEFVDE